MMAAVGVSASALPSSVDVIPGEQSVCGLRVRNDGSLVDEVTFQVLGDTASWVQVVPASLNLLPDTDGTVEVRLSPPRQPSTKAGPVAFGLKAISREDPEHSVVVQSVVNVAPFTEVTAQLVPQTSRAWRSGQHRVNVSSTSNHVVSLQLAAADPDDLLTFEIVPAVLNVAVGAPDRATVTAKARGLLFKRRAEPRPFQVHVRAADSASEDLAPISLGGTLMQRGLLALWLILVLVVPFVVLGFLLNNWVVAGVLLLVGIVVVVVGPKKLLKRVRSQGSQ